MSACDSNGAKREARRDFLKTMGAASAAMLASKSASSDADATNVAPKIPRIQIGKHSFSRLICGANCFNGGSHLSTFVNQAMKEYYTPDQIMKTLRRCEDVGVNTWQAGLGNIDLYRRYQDEGGNLQYIAIAAGKSSSVETLAQAGCIAIAHHGEVTDRMFKSGELDKMQDYLKQVRDAGMLVGVSTHMPDVVDAVESKGWDIDYYMTCVYERHRSKEDLERLLGQAPIPVGEVYLPLDPPRMYKMIQQTSKPCFAFKILAAGRLSERKHWVEQAFRDTFAAIKPTDGVIVGIYDRYSDQPAECAAWVNKFGRSSQIS